jgi:hypothetical protein
MLDRFERPLKIICLAMAALLAWQLAGLVLTGDPLKNLKIPALPALPGATNEPAKVGQKETNAAALNQTGTNGANATIATNAAGGTNLAAGTNAASGTNAIKGTNVVAGTNMAKGTNIVSGTNAAEGTNVVTSTNIVRSTNVVNGTNVTAKSTNGPAEGEAGQTNASSELKRGGSHKPGPAEATAGLPPGMTPEMLAAMPPEARANMMGGGMPGGRMGGGMKKIELPPEVQARVDRIIDSEFLGPTMRPMPMALIGIADQEAFIQATNGQTGPVKLGAEMAGIKLLRIGVNRVLVEQDGEKKELTLFEGIGGESLMPKSTNMPSTNLASTNAPSTNAPSTNAPSTNAPIRKVSTRNAAANVAHLSWLAGLATPWLSGIGRARLLPSPNFFSTPSTGKYLGLVRSLALPMPDGRQRSARPAFRSPPRTHDLLAQNAATSQILFS